MLHLWKAVCLVTVHTVTWQVCDEYTTVVVLMAWMTLTAIVNGQQMAALRFECHTASHNANSHTCAFLRSMTVTLWDGRNDLFVWYDEWLCGPGERLTARSYAPNGNEWRDYSHSILHLRVFVLEYGR